MVVLFLFFYVLAAVPLQAAKVKSEQAGYLIGAGDILDISVWKDPEQSRVVPVLPDGTISLPLIGTIQAEGKDVASLKNEIISKVSKFVADPVITLIVQKVDSMRVYVIGKVNRPGQYPLAGRLNVMQVLSMAGGLNTFAKRGEIKIMRQKNGFETIIIPFDYDEVADGEKLEQNILLQRGDTIVVP